MFFYYLIRSTKYSESKRSFVISSSSIYRGELSFLQPVHFCICWRDSAVLTGHLYRQWPACMCVPNWKNKCSGSGTAQANSYELDSTTFILLHLHSHRYTANRIWRVQRGGTTQANSYCTNDTPHCALTKFSHHFLFFSFFHRIWGFCFTDLFMVVVKDDLTRDEFVLIIGSIAKVPILLLVTYLFSSHACRSLPTIHWIPHH